MNVVALSVVSVTRVVAKMLLAEALSIDPNPGPVIVSVELPADTGDAEPMYG